MMMNDENQVGNWLLGWLWLNVGTHGCEQQTTKREPALVHILLGFWGADQDQFGLRINLLKKVYNFFLAK